MLLLLRPTMSLRNSSLPSITEKDDEDFSKTPLDAYIHPVNTSLSLLSAVNNLVGTVPELTLEDPNLDVAAPELGGSQSS